MSGFYRFPAVERLGDWDNEQQVEKLRDDMREAMTSSPDAMFMDSRWVDRLTALMEGGA